MLKPLFSQTCDLVGWMDPKGYIFDAELGYIAFVANGHAWSAATGAWIGPVNGVTLFDVGGFPVAWSPGNDIVQAGTPLRPVAPVRAVSPVRPIKPVQPMRPLGAPALPFGWSDLTFAQWLTYNDPKPTPPESDLVSDDGVEVK